MEQTAARVEPPPQPTDMMQATAGTVFDAFARWHRDFHEITRRAGHRFAACDWHGLQADAAERLDLYRASVQTTVEQIEGSLDGHARDHDFWMGVKRHHTARIAERHDYEIASSFYNSVVMRVSGTHGIDPQVHYVGGELNPPALAPHERIYRTYVNPEWEGANGNGNGSGNDGGTEPPTPRESRLDGTAGLLQDILLDFGLSAPFEQLDEDARLAAEIVDEAVRQMPRRAAEMGIIQKIEMADTVFYRGKAAYLVGRACLNHGHLPLVLVLFNSPAGITVDAVLLTADEVSIIFSFARSYFHAEVDRPHALVNFLKGIMPLKPVAELYISLGYNKHGKTQLYRDLVAHLDNSTDRFEIARGEKGMVMTVFTLHSYDVVFKVIKDSFDYPKRTTKQEVRNHYHLVFKHDRGGRLVDAQEFEHLRFDKSRFAPDLLEELLRVAGSTVVVDGDEVEVKHLYTERRLEPLNLYVREVDDEAAADATIDYGQAIKDLAATNIFPGDILLKNFGVTRHGRVVFYDYDELCLLTECVFRNLPQGQQAAGGQDEEDDDYDPFNPFDDWAGTEEPAFQVGEQDVFPEELRTFLGLPPHLANVFTRHHGDLFGVDFWAEMQQRHEAGEIIDILPYRETRRLRSRS